ncbi:hypothetical protein P8452_41844 [Trifolium repens]|nr:hypothetical protein P8452_41844 [Trifolium repens]
MATMYMGFWRCLLYFFIILDLKVEKDVERHCFLFNIGDFSMLFSVWVVYIFIFQYCERCKAHKYCILIHRTYPLGHAGSSSS